MHRNQKGRMRTNPRMRIHRGTSNFLLSKTLIMRAAAILTDRTDFIAETHHIISKTNESMQLWIKKKWLLSSHK